jgi:hypothetical protein
MAPSSLFPAADMRRKQPQERRCSYVVTLDANRTSPEELRILSQYLSSLTVADCDVVILDPSPQPLFAEHRDVLRWTGRHMPVPAGYRTASGEVDLARVAASAAACEKVIAATDMVRYTPTEIEQLCHLLDVHEVAEPQDYLDPLPWWGGFDAARVLVHRAVEPLPDHAATFGFRRSLVTGLRGLAFTDGDDHGRRLEAAGLEVHAAHDVFVRRDPPRLSQWIAERVRHADDDFAAPVKTALFFAVMPLMILLVLSGAAGFAASFAGAVACASVMLAVRGRSGAEQVFPARAILFAPLWTAERSITVYWALFRRLRGTRREEPAVAVADGTGSKVASGG